jgi:Leucine-rich repeat (LRR) protein
LWGSQTSGVEALCGLLSLVYTSPETCVTREDKFLCRITVVPQLPAMTELEDLYLQENQISRVETLRDLPSLRLLNMSFNRLGRPEHALHAAAILPSLTEFYLNGNPLETHPRWPSTLS